MESDVLKIRERPESKKKAKMKKKVEEKEKSASEDESSSDDDSGSDSDDSDSEDDNTKKDNEELDEEALREAAKAAAYFDNSSHVTAENNTIDSFNQLGLSRPLLRGVASMGFVTPTLVQASVLPVALAGRDVCASAVTGSKFMRCMFMMI